MSASTHQVGIFGGQDEPHVARVAATLRERGANPLIINLGDFPARLRIFLEDGIPHVDATKLDRPGAWYLRTIPLTLPFFDFDPNIEAASVAEVLARWRSRYAAERERQSFLAGFMLALARHGARLVNPPATFDQHFVKTEQLDRLRAAGVPVPRTLATNDTEALRRFVADVDAPVVYKPLAGGALCRRLEPIDLEDARLETLARAPVLFQEEVAGKNIRVYVVAGRVVAAYEIVAPELDYRGNEQEVIEVTLPEEEEHAAIRAAEACAMIFTGLDIKRRVDNSFAVLECNPSPMFAGIERWTEKTLVTEALADLLLAPF